MERAPRDHSRNLPRRNPARPKLRARRYLTSSSWLSALSRPNTPTGPDLAMNVSCPLSVSSVGAKGCSNHVSYSETPGFAMLAIPRARLRARDRDHVRADPEHPRQLASRTWTAREFSGHGPD